MRNIEEKNKKEVNRNHLHNALLTAAALIQFHGSNGGDPDEYDCEDEYDLELYSKQCLKACKLIETLAKKYNK